jgi:hypothetical protein
VAWKGSFSSPPANPQTNWAYYDTVQGRSYIWDGSSWNIMSQDGTVIGGVPEAPDDGKSYVRKSKLWSEMPTPVVDYDDLTDKPAIDGTTLTKDSTAAGLGLETAANAGNNADLETTAKTTKVAAINELADGKLDKKTIYPDTSWEWFKPEVDGGGHWYWDFSTSTLRFEGFNNDSGSAVVWERYSISGGGPNFQLSGGSRIGARLIVAWDGGARGAGTLRTYYTTGRADSSFTAEDEIASQQWVRTLIAGEAGKPLPAVADHAALLALTGMKVNDWVYVEDDTPVHAGETWAYAYDGTNWVELVRINEVQVQDDDITLEIDSVSGKRQVKAGGIGTTQLASGAATDNVIGNRQVEDNPASDTLPEADTGFTLGQWLQKIRDNIKFALSKFIAKVDGVEPDSSRNVSVMRRITADEAQALIDDPTQAEPGVKYYVPETGDLLGEGIDWDSGVAVDMGTPPSVTDKEWLSNEYTANELCYIRTVTYGSSTAGNFCIWYVINGSQMLIDGNELLNTIGFYTRTIKLSKGDKLRIIIQRDGSSVANSLHIIRFLPIKLKPKFTAIKNPTLVVEEGSDYSYDEQPVMIRLPDGTVRQKTWVDGKPIWRITVSSPWIPTTVNSNYNLWIMSGVARVISAQNSILDTLGEYIVGDSFDRYDTSKIYRIVVHSTADSNLYLQMIQFDFFTQIQVENVYSTIEYTKG